jgi:hypothetical protein
MNLQEQGFRFILRREADRVDGYWEHPATMRPGGFDATDLDDDALAAAVYDMQDGHEPAKP